MNNLNTNTNKKTIISPNLLPKGNKEQLYCRIVGETIKRVVQILAVMLLFFWLLGGILLWKINREENGIATNLETSTNNNKLQELKKINDQFKELRVLNTKVDKSLQKEYRFSEVLAELLKITPQGVVLTTFETSLGQPGWVKVKGSAESRDNFLLLKKGMEESKFYEKVESPLSNYVASESFSFELSAQLGGFRPVWEKDVKKKPAAAGNTNE